VSEKISTQDIEEGLVLAPKFDANGLVTCVATDASSGDLLMVAHMNAEALRRTVETGDSCTWTRASEIPPPASEVPDMDTIATATVSGEGRSIVTVDEGDAAFVTGGCGTWVPDVGPITLRPNQPFVSGTYRVGRDIAPGTWKASNTAVCGWARLSGFGGEESDVIADGRSSDVQTVTIDEGDAGFTADEACGTWTLQPV
jgi:hypothetical protein